MRSVMAVLAGYAVLAALVGAKFALLQQFASSTFTNGMGLAFIIATDALAALAGGYVLAIVARRAVIAHVLVLVAILVPLGVLSAMLNQGQEPLWFQMAVPAVMAAALPCGAWLRGSRRTMAVEPAALS